MAQIQLLTVQEVATLRRRTRWTVYRWVREGYLQPRVSDFGRFLISRKDLENLPKTTKTVGNTIKTR